MFEQSMLLERATGRKARALAASLTAQTLAVGLLLLIPVIYSDRFPDVRPWTSLPLPVLPLRAVPEPVVDTAAAPSRRPSLSVPRPLSLPMRTPQPQGPVVVDLVVPAIGPGVLFDGVPVGPGSPALPRLIEVLPPPATPGARENPRPVGGDVQAAKLIKKVVPVYPPLARQARVSGIVRLIGVIAKDGTIQRLEVQSGHALLVRAALDAVRQWVYQPTLLNGEAVEVMAPIDVIFTLSQ